MTPWRHWPFHTAECEKALYYGMGTHWDQACTLCKARILWHSYKAIMYAIRHARHKL